MGDSEKKPRAIQLHSGNGGCPFWRMYWQGYLLNLSERIRVIQLDSVPRDLIDFARINAIHIQKLSSQSHLRFYEKLAALKDRFRFRMIFEVDDALELEDIPKYNMAYHLIKENEDKWNIPQAMDLFDEVTVTTHALRDYYMKKCNQKNFTVIPNYPPMFWIGREYDEEILRRNYRRYRAKPRILYAGSASHFDHRDIPIDEIVDDFSPVKEAVLKSIKDFQWVFVGAMPQILKPFVETGEVEFYGWQQMDIYPRFLASLRINMCIAPLQNNVFNQCKSDLKFLEASALGLPIACQNMSIFSIAPIKFDTGDEMIEKVNETLRTEESYIEASRNGRRLLQSRWLENVENIGKYRELYTLPYDHSERKYLS